MVWFKSTNLGIVAVLMLSIILVSCGGEDSPAIEVISEETTQSPAREPGSLIGTSIEDFPDDNLVNQDGESVSIETLPDKPLMISFIYTRCPMQSMCPRVTDQLAKIQERVNRQGKKPVQFVLVTFDPEYDRPEVLKEYADKFKIDYDNFSLWTGELESVDEFVESFKIMVMRDGEDIKTHNMRTYLIDRDRVIRHRFRQSDWTVDEVMQPLWEML